MTTLRHNIGSSTDPRKPTRAQFVMVLNPDQGAIISLGSFGPAQGIAKWGVHVLKFLKVKAYSDMTFLQWQELVGKEGKDMKNIRTCPSSAPEARPSSKAYSRRLHYSNSGRKCPHQHPRQSCTHCHQQEARWLARRYIQNGHCGRSSTSGLACWGGMCVLLYSA